MPINNLTYKTLRNLSHKIFRGIRKRIRNTYWHIKLRKYASEKDVPLSNIKYLHIVIGMKCNFRCKMCFQKDFTTDADPLIYKEKIFSIYPYIKEACLQGGEPTVILECKEFTEFLIKINPQIKFNIITNGYLFDDYWIEKSIKYGKWVNFSLNAASKETHDIICRNDTWNRVILNLQELVDRKKLKNSGLEIGASFVVLDENIHEFSKFIEFCHKMGLDIVTFYYDSNLLPKNKILVEEELKRAYSLRDRLKDIRIENLEKFESWALNKNEKMPKVHCSRPFDTIFVAENGNVKFCCNVLESLGNLHDEPIEELWNNLRAKRFRRIFKNGDYRYCGVFCRCPDSISSFVGKIEKGTAPSSNECKNQQNLT